MLGTRFPSFPLFFMCICLHLLDTTLAYLWPDSAVDITAEQENQENQFPYIFDDKDKILPITEEEKPSLYHDICMSFPTSYREYANQSSLISSFETIRKYPIASWYTKKDKHALTHISEMIQQCDENQKPLIVIHGLPCEKAEMEAMQREQLKPVNIDAYMEWIDQLVETVKDYDPVYILEPNALSYLVVGKQCSRDYDYMPNLKYAIEKLNGEIYLGVSQWTLRDKAERNRAMDITNKTDSSKKIAGFALNIAGYESIDASVELCNTMVELSSERTISCIVDTSRNYKRVDDLGIWCNNPDAGIGVPPRYVGFYNIAYYLWIKPPGESDGNCGHAEDTEAGSFSTRLFARLWNNGYFVHENQQNKIENV